MEPHKPTIIQHGPAATHDQCCAIYHGQSAVYDLNQAVFRPSWKAQREGWQLVYADSWWKRALVRLALT
jgi:hypothetical protein